MFTRFLSLDGMVLDITDMKLLYQPPQAGTARTTEVCIPSWTSFSHWSLCTPPMPSVSAKPGSMIPFWTLNSISPTSLWFAGTETGTAVALLPTSMTPSLSRPSPVTPRSNWSFLNYLFGLVISPVPLSIAHRLLTHLFYTISKTP